MPLSQGRLLITAALAISISMRAFGQNSSPSAELQSDQTAYCEYISQQAQAQRDLLRTPSAVAGITKPNVELPMQLVWGVTGSLSDIRKAGLTMDVAQKNCELYTATTSVQQSILYALPSLEKQALQHRLDLIQQAAEKLDTLTGKMTGMLDARNITRPMLFSLQTTRIKLEADRAETRTKIALLDLPEPDERPVKELVARKQSSESAAQTALARLTRQNDWDVALSVGARQQVSPFDSRGAYGAVTVSHNLASHAINKHLDQAAEAYAEWKKAQQGDVTRNASMLKQQVTQGIAAQQARLASLQEEQKQVISNLQLVENIDTTAALDFQNQLASTQLLLGIEMGDAGFRLELMRGFLERNY